MFSFIIIVILSGLGLYYRQNKAIFILLLLVCILIMGLNYDNPDYINYELGFNHASIPPKFTILGTLDIGSKFVIASFKEFGINNYSIYRLVYTTILFLIFGITIYKNCKYPNIMLIIYIIFYIVLDEIQMRNFSSFVIILPFLIYYSKHQNIKGAAIYLTGIFLAFTFHFSAIFYTIFVFSILKSKCSQYFILGSCIILILFATSLFTGMIMLDHVEHYTRPSIAGALASSALLVFNYFFIQHYNKKSRLIHHITGNTLLFIKSFNVITKYNFLLMVLIPVIFINSTVLRIWRFTSLLNIIFLLGLIFYLHGSKQSKKLLLITFVYAALISIWSSYDGVWSSILNNQIFD